MNKFNEARQLKIAGINESTEEMCSCNVCEGTLPVFENQQIFESEQLNEFICGGLCIAGAIATVAGLAGTAYSVYDSYTSPYSQDDLDSSGQDAYDQGYQDAGGSSSEPETAISSVSKIPSQGTGQSKPSATDQATAAANVKNAQDAQTLQKLKSAAPYAAAGVGGLALMKALSKKKEKKKKDTAEESYHYNKVVRGK